MSRARKSLIKNLIVGVTKSNLKDVLPADERRRQLSAIGAIVEMHRTQAEEILRTDLPRVFRATEDINLWALIAYCRRVPMAWDAADEATKGRLTTYIQTVTDDNILKAIANAMSVQPLKEVTILRLKGLSADDLGKLIRGNPHHEYVEPAIQFFASSMSWRGAEQLGKTLIIPLAGVLKADDIVQILEAVKNNDQIWNAGGMRDILIELFDATSVLHSLTTSAWQKLIKDLNKKTEWYSKLQERLEAAGIMTEADAAGAE